MFGTYEDFIKKEIESFKSYGIFYDMAIKYLPPFFKLACNLLDMDDISHESRIRINCAIAYLVIPNDALPEKIYGAEGYMDDLFVMVYVLKELFPKHKEIIRAQWLTIVPQEFGNSDIEHALNECYVLSMNVLKERNLVDKTLEFAGLKKA